MREIRALPTIIPVEPQNLTENLKVLSCSNLNQMPHYPLVKSTDPQKITFTGVSQSKLRRELTSEQLANCRWIIHGGTALCAAVSTAAGETEAIPATLPIIWAIQAKMLIALGKELNTDPASGFLYGLSRTIAAGSIGSATLKAGISALGIAGHTTAGAGTGGAASIPITETVRTLNSGITSGLAELIGWGYVKDCLNKKMTIESQAKSFFMLCISAGVGGFLDNQFDSMLDAIDVDLPLENGKSVDNFIKQSKKALSSLSIETTTTHTLADFIGRLSGKTVIDNIIDNKNVPLTFKDFKAAFSESVMGTTVGELIGMQFQGEVETEVIERATQECSHELMNNPNVYNKLVETMNDAKMQSTFKNLKHISNKEVSEFADKLRDMVDYCKEQYEEARNDKQHR